jgi:membrane-associated PAP2 superfamily phosphatase
MTSISGSKCQAESNGCTFVTRHLFVPEIATLTFMGVAKILRWRHFLGHNFKLNPMVAYSSPCSFSFRRCDAILYGRGQNITLTSFSGSQFQAESNRCIFVTRLLYVPGIAKLSFMAVAKILRWRHFLGHNFKLNPLVWFSSPGFFSFRR